MIDCIDCPLFFAFSHSRSSVLRYNIRLTTFLCISTTFCTAQRKEPIDADHYPVQISKIRGGVYLVEDPNYWKTNTVFYVGPEGVVFINGGWTSKSASQILWKAATLSYQDFIAVIPVSAGLHHTGGLWEFRKQRVPIFLTREISTRLTSHWEAWNTKMRSFGSWKVQDQPQADDFLSLGGHTSSPGSELQRMEMLGGKMVLIFPGSTSSPDALAVYFPEERILYAGDMLSDPAYFLDRQPHARENVEKLRNIPFTTIVSGHGEAVRPRDFFERTWSFQ